MILNELIMGEITTLNYFYMEWLFNTPLILIDLGKLTNISLYHYVYIILLDQIMIITGYVSYITQNMTLTIIMFIIGVICYIILNSIYLINFKRFINDNNQQTRRCCIFRIIYFTVAICWLLYPITHILFKTDKITFNTTVNIYIILDVLTKGIFTTLMLGYKEIYQKHNSLLKNIFLKLFRIHPLEDLGQNNIEDNTNVNTVINKHTLELVSINTVSSNNTITKSSPVSTVHSTIHSVNDNKDINEIFDDNSRRKSLKIKHNFELNSIVEGSREVRTDDESPYIS